MTPDAFTPCPSPCGCGLIGFPADACLKAVILATEVNSLARYSKRTIQPLKAVSNYSYQVSGSFHSLAGVLFNVPSRYSYAIGLQSYLGLEVDAPQIQAPYPRSPTLAASHPRFPSTTGLSPSVASRSRELRVRKHGRYDEPKHHISPGFHQRIQFALRGFQSPLLTASQLVSSPVGTQTFQFPTFPAYRPDGNPIERSPVQCLHAARRSLSQLATSFISAEA